LLSKTKIVNFDLALALHIFENPTHLVLFDETTLISIVNGLPKYFKKVIEIKKKIHKPKFSNK
jgi:hypothetical protein